MSMSELYVLRHWIEGFISKHTQLAMTSWLQVSISSAVKHIREDTHYDGICQDSAADKDRRLLPYTELHTALRHVR
jgi:hypothetical protein